MTRRGICIAVLLCTVLLTALPWAAANELISESALAPLDVQRYWDMALPLSPSETVARIALLDDNLYVLTTANNVFTVHSRTGVIRWSALVASAGKEVRGPSHSAEHVLFTTPGGVRVFDRQTGDLISDPRSLEGIIIDVTQDSAALTIGQVHGVRADDLFGVYRLRSDVELEDEPLAKLRITSVETSRSRGRLSDYDRDRPPQAGDRIKADVKIPLENVKLPFAASSAAVANQSTLYVGAANQRFYALDILSGFQHWQLMTPGTVTATPKLFGGNLLIAGQDGSITVIKLEDRKPKWVFHTAGPMFADPVVTDTRVYLACSDRSLYCLDLETGERLWRERFDSPLNTPPAVSDGRVFQPVPDQGLIVLDADRGELLWRSPVNAAFLVQFAGDAYLLTGPGAQRVVRVEAATGKEKAYAEACMVLTAVGHQSDQSILLASCTGELMCLRSSKAPRLDPAELAEVLRNDQKTRLLKEAAARQTAKAEVKKTTDSEGAKKESASDLFGEFDWLRSLGTARPLGARPAEGDDKAKKPADKPKKESDADQETDEADEADDEEDEEAEEDEDDMDASSDDEEEAEEEEEEEGDEEAEEDEEEEEAEEDEDEGGGTGGGSGGGSGGGKQPPSPTGGGKRG